MYLVHKAGVCTIIAKNYLSHARVLMESVRKRAPELLRVVILVDRVDEYFDPLAEDFVVIPSEDLKIPDSRWFHFKYPLLELCTAVKPYALELLFERYNLDKLIYVDPDTRFYNPLEHLLGLLDEHGVILTPHLTAPPDDSKRPSELEILQYGIYNLGFIALSKRTETFRFLKWWQAKLFDGCVIDVERGFFVDQRWVDLAPAFFEGVHISREPGYNVAYWNLDHRRVEQREDGYLVNGRPLCFFHFSGVKPDNPEELLNHPSYRMSELGDGKTLVLDYVRDLYDRGYAECKTWPYAFGRFHNGVPIPDIARPVHRECEEMVQRIADPFSREGFEAFCEVWNQPAADPKESHSEISRLAYRIYKNRSDIQAAMPDIFRTDRTEFLQWLVSAGVWEHDIDGIFLDSLRNLLQAAKGGTPPIARAVPEYLTERTRMIWKSRPDLQRAFPDPRGRDAARFLAWSLTYGKREHPLSEEEIGLLHHHWDDVLRAAGSATARIGYRMSLAAMSASIALKSLRGALARRRQTLLAVDEHNAAK